MKTIQLILKPEREKPIKGRHPWVYSGAIDQIDDNYKTGDLVRVYSAQKEFLGTGYLNPRAQIAVRMLSFVEEEIDQNFFSRRIDEAIALREHFLKKAGTVPWGLAPAGACPRTNAYRLIHSEGDFLPGLIVDRYADYLVVQLQTAGIEKWRDTIVSLLAEKVKVRGIYERDDSEAREWEGLEKRAGLLQGEEPPDYVEIEEYGIKFIVDIHAGQKTGFFLDQRENRKGVGELSAGKRVLNCFAYTGGFSVYAALGGAERVVSVETSERALNTARTNFELNFPSSPQPSPPGGGRGEGEGDGKFEFVQKDAFDYLRETKEEFDLIILDPPAFAQSKDHIMKASRAYKDINLWAMKRLASEGLLYTSSCSSYIDPDLFQKIIFAAAKDARRSVRVIKKTSHAFDHPINIYHPEGEYLKGLLCWV